MSLNAVDLGINEATRMMQDGQEWQKCHHVNDPPQMVPDTMYMIALQKHNKK